MWSLTAGSLGGSGNGLVTNRWCTKFLCGVLKPTSESTWFVHALTAQTVASASMDPPSVTTPVTRPPLRSNPVTCSFSLISTPMSSSLARRAGTYRCGSEYPARRSSGPLSESCAARSGNRSLISPPRSTSNCAPSCRHMSKLDSARAKASSVTRFRQPTWWKRYPSRIRLNRSNRSRLIARARTSVSVVSSIVTMPPACRLEPPPTVPLSITTTRSTPFSTR